jgi:hypothetical protein
LPNANIHHVLRIRTRNEAHHVAKKMTGPTKQSIVPQADTWIASLRSQ